MGGFFHAGLAMTVCAAVAVTAGGVAGAPGSARAASVVAVPGSVPATVGSAVRVGAASASQRLTVQVWLKPDAAGAAAFADAVATPGSPRFHHYLSPDAYTARFGPSPAQAGAVAAWLTGVGLTGVQVDGDRDRVSATGPVPAVESAFQIRIGRYRAVDAASGAEGRSSVFTSNDREVSVPASLASDVLGVTGLSDAPAASRSTAASAPPSHAAAKAATCSRYWAQHAHALHPAYQGLARASLPVCGYSAAQLRAGYGATSRDTGRGQTVALTEDEPPTAMFRTLTAYARSNHLPLPKQSQFRQVQAGNACQAPSAADRAAQSPRVDVEAEMDSEAVYAMAPGADQVMVVGTGCDEDQALLDAASAVLAGDGHHPLASIVSNSWQIPLGEVSPQTVHAIDVRAAAEGVGMYFASGDTPGLTVTDSDPYAVAVGGTTLGVGAAGNRVFETGWSDDFGSLSSGKWTDLGVSGGGGGVSDVYRQPSYQKGVVPASMARVGVAKKTVLGRTVPDIAAAADPDTGMLTGYTATDGPGKPGRYRTVSSAGTSLSTPLVAGLVADAQQGRTSPYGFINPLLYRLARTRAFHDALPISTSAPQQNRAAYVAPDDTFTSVGVDVFDAQKHPDTQQVTAKGYDTMTGLGTPNGADFINALRRGR
ncbi:protease pro-enzyme activation domain-containing protein [Streptomyces sp. SL13]|uniref:Protease pro-enzyme activation domain-containing protein n=1 Tax=Streptantibioticus silvisoli TaxID=2705255 RepID=A0AA90HD18_9ACTN|nr:protease pro-enzyme activation domain-containing protein [Streptantibioticus silvisoli]MDI5974147.1 protease pro-enzyme activation domain-containing protein [Streptantibioticus silvisoli]